MAVFEGKSPAERNKIIVAIVLGVLAVASLIYTFGGLFIPSGKTTPTTASGTPTPVETTDEALATTEIRRLPKQNAIDLQYRSVPINFNGIGASSIPVTGRNIFAFWEPGDPVPKAYVEPKMPTPVQIVDPTPFPYKIFLSFVTPQSIYSGSKEFRIEVNGDKFTESSRIVFNGAPLQTTFISSQRLAANVPAGLIVRAYTGSIMVDIPDSNSFSRTVAFNVQEPPRPTLEYIGMIARQHYNNDTAYFQKKGASREDPTSARLNDVVEGRFRVVSISAKEVEFEDTRLGFRHTVPLLRPKPGTSGVTGNSGYGDDGFAPGQPIRRNPPGINPNNVRRRTPRPRTARTPNPNPNPNPRVNNSTEKIPGIPIP